MRRAMGILALAALVLGAPVVALARSGGSVSGLLLRVQGDVIVDEDESADLVMVVSGDAYVYGRAGVVVVVGGRAQLVDARVGRLVVVRGSAELQGTTRVAGDVWLMSAGVEEWPGAVVSGSVRGVFGVAPWQFVVEEPLLAVGLLGLAIGVGLVALALGSATMRRAAGALIDDVLGALGAALLLFLVAPAAALLLFFTVVGMPVSLAYLVVCLPALALAGFCVSALRLGLWLLRSGSPRPYGAAVLGSLGLAAAGLIPYAGQIFLAAAGAFGAGALAVAAWRGSEEAPGAAPTVVEG